MKTATLNWMKKQEAAFLKARRFPIDGSTDFLTSVPSSGGIYVLWSTKSESPAYVGETCHLKLRIQQLVSLGGHVFRRKLASTLDLDPKDAAAIFLALSGGYKISYQAIDRGRKELEEFLLVRWNRRFPASLVNGVQKRFTKTDDYKQIQVA